MGLWSSLFGGVPDSKTVDSDVTRGQASARNTGERAAQADYHTEFCFKRQ